jgi:hypothetical protein
MKKIIIAAALILGFTIAASAQPRAIGVRLGNGGEISYQHSLDRNFLEVDGGLGLGFDGVFNVGATGIYNFMIAQPDWTDRGEWGFYAGPGAGVGLALGEVNYLALSAAGMVGLEYTFWFPLQISIDFRQHVGIGLSGNGLWTPSSVSLSLRYRL